MVDREKLAALAAQHDPSDMAAIIAQSPEQIGYALTDADLPRPAGGPYQRAAIAGMGGSAFPVDVLADAFEGRFRGTVTARRRYDLPTWVDDQTLVVASSFSGNTEEALSAIDDLPHGAPNVFVLTAGGRLAELAKERGYPLARVPAEQHPANFQPRSATGYMVTYMARILSEAGILEDPRPLLEPVVGFLRDLDVRSGAEEVAEWFGDRIPLIYTDAQHELSVARITKIKLNENSKRPAFFNCLSEANHNEMIGLSGPLAKFALLYLRDPDSHPRIDERFRAMRAVFADMGIHHVDFREWTMPGSTRVERIFAALLFGDWCSYTLALLDGHDPTPVGLVEHFKGVLRAGTE
jgi:glucose/mannose-6-phosphate isomerase